jgi:hypothetical protein
MRNDQCLYAFGGDHPGSLQIVHMPIIATPFGSMAEQAMREKKSHIGDLEALRLAEMEEKSAAHSHRFPSAS